VLPQNLRLDRTEHQEFSAEQPALYARMRNRMAELRAAAFQTSANFTAGFDNCQKIDYVVTSHHGFVAPCCAKGDTWWQRLRCGASDWTVFSPANYRGSWTCDATNQTVMALDDAGAGGGAIGFARLGGTQQPPAGADGFTLRVSVRLGDGGDSATCGYRTGGVLVGMASAVGSASSNFRNAFDGYSVEWTPPGCNRSSIAIKRYDTGIGRSSPPDAMQLVGRPLSTEVSSAGWLSLEINTNTTHISAGLAGFPPLLEAALLPGKPIGCGGGGGGGELGEPWEPLLPSSHDDDACAVGLFQHRVQAEWRELSFK
jgi:hypothetical protein